MFRSLCFAFKLAMLFLVNTIIIDIVYVHIIL